MRRACVLITLLGLPGALQAKIRRVAVSTAAAVAPTPRTDEAERGTLRVILRTQGTVKAEDIFRIKSTIEGRVESVQVSSYSWAGSAQLLGTLANKELAALLDSKATTPKAIVEERWQPVFEPTPMACPSECFVLKVFARLKKWVEPEAILFEAAGHLRLFGRIRPGDSQWIQDGQLIRFWDRKNPKRKIEARVEHFVLDVQGEKTEPGGTFTALLDSKHYLDPGTEWEGYIVAEEKKDVIHVPTAALIEYNGELYLPVRVSTGITSYEVAEITAGVSEHQKVLILDPGRLRSLKTYVPRRMLTNKGAPEVLWERKGRRRDWDEEESEAKEDSMADYPSDVSHQH